MKDAPRGISIRQEYRHRVNAGLQAACTLENGSAGCFCPCGDFVTRSNHNADVGTFESAELIRLGFRAVPFVVAFPLARCADGGRLFFCLLCGFVLFVSERPHV